MSEKGYHLDSINTRAYAQAQRLTDNPAVDSDPAEWGKNRSTASAFDHPAVLSHALRRANGADDRFIANEFARGDTPVSTGPEFLRGRTLIDPESAYGRQFAFNPQPWQRPDYFRN